jgi:hypothetical protein
MPNRCTYLHFQKLTPESTLEEIWYGIRELHQIGAHIRCTYLRFQKPGGTQSESFSTRPKRSSTQKLFHVRHSTQQLHHKQDDLVDWD